jgi:hypothetical protein
MFVNEKTGRIGMLVELYKAQISKHPRYSYDTLVFEDEICSVQFFKDGKPCGKDKDHPDGRPIVWDKARAQKAELWGKGNWVKYPRNMLLARCISDGVRAYCDGLFGGAAVEAVTGKQDLDLLCGDVVEERKPIDPATDKSLQMMAQAGTRTRTRAADAPKSSAPQSTSSETAGTSASTADTSKETTAQDDAIECEVLDDPKQQSAAAGASANAESCSTETPAKSAETSQEIIPNPKSANGVDSQNASIQASAAATAGTTDTAAKNDQQQRLGRAPIAAAPTQSEQSPESKSDSAQNAPFNSQSVTPEQLKHLGAMAKDNGWSREQLFAWVMQTFGFNDPKDIAASMTTDQLLDAMNHVTENKPA